MRILMVCLGNICRSPLAHGILRKKIREFGLEIEVDSAGTSSYHIGDAPDSRMSETAKKFGVFIDDLTARQFVVSDFDRFDLIYAMDTSNYNNIISLARNDTDISKVKLILNESHPDQDLSVPDPYYGGDQGFIDVYNLLDETTDIIMKKMTN